MEDAFVPDIVVGRLPLYLRALTELEKLGEQIISSHELGARLGISSAQIRKDLSQFGEFGKQGMGYNVKYLASQLKRILKVEGHWEIVLVGAGDLGHAVANYAGFEDRGFRIVAVYDNDPEKIGKRAGSFIVQDTKDLEEGIRARNLKVAMLAVPASSAQEVAERLVNAGILAILCYAPTTLALPDHIRVQYIDPVVHVQHMTYYLP
jgi:redox-sensing transcriptional repressor